MTPEQEGLTQEWVSVPKVATPEMENAGGRALIHAENASYEEDARDVWEAMLAASPTPPAGRKATPDLTPEMAEAAADAFDAYESDQSPWVNGRLTVSGLARMFAALNAALAAGGAA